MLAPLETKDARDEGTVTLYNRAVMLSLSKHPLEPKDARGRGTCLFYILARHVPLTSASPQLRGSLDCAPPTPGGTPLGMTGFIRYYRMKKPLLSMTGIDRVIRISYFVPFTTLCILAA